MTTSDAQFKATAKRIQIFYLYLSSNFGASENAQLQEDCQYIPIGRSPEHYCAVIGTNGLYCIQKYFDKVVLVFPQAR